MSRTVFLHVGLPKSGTSYVQKVLAGNKARLKEAGLLFPGRSWSDQVRAVQDVRWSQATPRRPAVDGAWKKLVSQVQAWPQDAIISMEWLGSASPDQIQVISDDLRPARLQVVFTARDLARTVPAAWQEFMQNRFEWSWADFLESVAADDHQRGGPGARFWAQQDLADLLRRWTSFVPVEQVHVVTLPHPGAAQETLWQRMSQVLGDRGAVELDVSRGNESLGLESAELMRRLNRHARTNGVSRPLYNRTFKHELAKNLLAQRKDQESRLRLPREYHDWVRRQSDQQIDALSGSGVRVVGDVQDLRPVLEDGAGDRPDAVSTEVLLEASLSTLVAVAQQWDEAQGSVRRLRRRSRRLARRLRRLRTPPARTHLRSRVLAARKRLSPRSRSR